MVDLEHKPSTEWLPGDVIDLAGGMRGFWIKESDAPTQGKIVEVFSDIVQVKFPDDETTQSYLITPALTVRRLK